MEEVERNIDAYRIVFEILNDLRAAVRRELERVHGREWPRAGVPAETLAQLIDRKEREKAIDWYETEYQELTDFSGFEDLLCILEHNPTLLTEVRKLAPSPALFHARFLELEVMRSKLGLARPISENELSFLGTFHLRFRKAVDAQGSPSQPAPEAPPSPPAQVKPPVGQEAAPEEAAEVEIEEPGAVEPPPEPAPARGDDRTPVAAPTGADTGESRLASSGRVTPPAGAPAPAPVERSVIEVALESNDHRTVFRELYREVMGLAEGLWTTDVPGEPRVWDKVRVSEWYEDNFARRGLKPLSDFYGVLGQVWDKMREGIARDELQDFLKKTNFAQLLLSLRDMFQKNQV